MKRLIIAILSAVLAAGAFVSACSSDGTPRSVKYPGDASELPVSRVVMYQSGIGYVERTATVSEDELILRIRPDQINDILKSLTVIDRADGRPVSISLPVDKTALDALAQIPEQVKSGGIRSLISAFRGANVKISAKGSSYEGRIVGLDESNKYNELNVAINDKKISDDTASVTIMTPNDVLQVISLSDIRSVALYDKSLAEGLDKSLNISLNDGSWKQIELRIRMDSKKKREVALSYLVAMPTWKPAYRLILSDGDKGVLQGWAVVSNVTGADWNNISFSLVSGQPMSFTYNLYTPQFLRRPDLSGLAVKEASAPEVVKSGYGAKKTMAAAESTAGRAPMAAAKSRAPMANAMMDMAADEGRMFDTADEMSAEAAVISADEMVSNFSELASQAQIGSFDEYKLASKLSVPDGSTALVNLIQSNFSARDTRLIKADNIYAFDNFYKGWRNSQSFQTIELKNTAESALDSGPITIYRDSAVIGEGYLSRTEKDATAYITFANESRLTVSVADQNSERKSRLDSFENGRCVYTTEITEHRNFAFDSRIGNETTALFQIRRYSNWEPTNFPETTVVSDDKYIVPVVLAANESKKVLLSMKHEYQNSENLTSSARNTNECYDAIKSAIAAGEIDREIQPLFEQLTADAARMQEIQIKSKTLAERKTAIDNDQNGLRQTLAGLKDVKSAAAESLRKQLLDRQSSNEKALVDITTELYALQVERGEIELRMRTNVQSIHYIRK